MPRLDVRIHKPKKGAATLSADRKSISVHVPLKFVDRGGRKLVVTPDGSNAPTVRVVPVESTTKALARAFRWRKLLESGAYNSIEDLARAEKINASYVSRVLRLTLLAPEIVMKLMEQKLSATTGVALFRRPVPVEWKRQARFLLGCDR